MQRLSRLRPVLPTLATFLALFAVGLAIVALVEQAGSTERRRVASELNSQFARHVEQHLTHALSATHALAATVRQGQGHIADFVGQARQMLPLYPGVSALQLAPGGVIGEIVPLAGNEKAIGHNLLADTARNKEARLAIATRRLTLAGPFTLRQGGEAVIGRLPVFLDTPSGEARFWGFTIALIRLPDFLAALNLTELERLGYRYELWRVHPDSGARHVFAHSRLAPGEAPVTTAFDVPNGRWYLSVAPATGWRDPAREIGEGILAFLLSALLALAGHNYLRNRRTLQQSEESYRSLFDSVQEAVYVQSRDGVFLAANQGAARMYGRPPEWFVGKSPADVSAPGRNDLAAASQMAERAFAGTPQTFEFWGVRADGSEFPKEVHLARGRWFGQHVLFALARDIGERRRLEAETQLAASVFEHSREGIMITDAAARILKVNKAFCRITGYGRDEVVGNKPSLLASGLHNDGFYAGMWQAIEAQGYWSGEIWNRRKDGELFPERISIAAVHDKHGRLSHYVGLFSDISALKKHEKQLEHIAHHDALTGLPNRVLLADRMRQGIAQTRRAGQMMAVGYLDLDGFKPINDSHGHEAGDRLLIEIARRMKQVLRGGDTIARLGGDEFAFLLLGLNNLAECETTLGRILEAIAQPLRVDELHRVTLSASVGVTLYPGDDTEPDTLLRHADQAMYRAKQAGKNRYQFHVRDDGQPD